MLFVKASWPNTRRFLVIAVPTIGRVRAPEKSLLEGTKPDSVKPATFELVLGNSEATLADVLKRDIKGKDSTGKDGKYRVYVELPAKPEKAATTSRGVFDATSREHMFWQHLGTVALQTDGHFAYLP